MMGEKAQPKVKAIKFAVLCLILMLGVYIVASSQEEGESELWTVQKSLKIKTIGALEISPDSEDIVFNLREAVMVDGDWDSRTQIWMTRNDRPDCRMLTAKEYSSWSPTWSPDGRHIAFLSDRGGKTDIWLMEKDGGNPKPLTDCLGQISSFQWAPEGKRIVFFKSVIPKNSDHSLLPKAIRRIVRPQFFSIEIFLIEVFPNGGASDPVQLTDLGQILTGMDWAPDGRTIVFSRQPSAENNAIFDNDISLVDTETRKITPLVRQPGWDLQPCFSPDGAWIAFASAGGDTNRSIHRYHHRIALISVEGGAIRYLASSPSMLQGMIDWQTDGNGLLFGESHGTVSRIYAAPTDGSPLKSVYFPGRGVIGSVDISRDGSLMAYIHTFMNKPNEIYVRKGDGDPVQVTDINSWAEQMRYARSEVITWRSPGGVEIEGILTYPLDYQEGKKYPLLLSAHAGLYHHNQNHTARFTGFHIQELAAEGFVVLRPNPRGSNNGSWEFRSVIAQDWSGITYKDNMGGIEAVIKMGLADSARMGVFGWSTGGFMASWIIARTDRFKAAAIGAAPVNLISFTGTSDDTDWLPAFFGHEAFENSKPFFSQSSLLHMKRVTTPTILFWGEKDKRVPLSQGWEFFNTLKRQGVDVEFVIYPNAGHMPTDPKQMLNIAKRVKRLFRKHLQEAGND